MILNCDDRIKIEKVNIDSIAFNSVLVSGYSNTGKKLKRALISLSDYEDTYYANKKRRQIDFIDHIYAAFNKFGPHKYVLTLKCIRIIIDAMETVYNNNIVPMLTHQLAGKYIELRQSYAGGFTNVYYFKADIIDDKTNCQLNDDLTLRSDFVLYRHKCSPIIKQYTPLKSGLSTSNKVTLTLFHFDLANNKSKDEYKRYQAVKVISKKAYDRIYKSWRITKHIIKYEA